MADIQQLLHDANVDFRDCYEKSELINRLKEYEKQLPASVRNRLRSMANSSVDLQTSGSNQPQAHHSFKQRLFSDEQYVVNVFNVRFRYYISCTIYHRWAKNLLDIFMCSLPLSLFHCVLTLKDFLSDSMSCAGEPIVLNVLETVPFICTISNTA